MTGSISVKGTLIDKYAFQKNYLEGLGDSVQWLSQESRPLNYPTSLLAHLEQYVPSGTAHSALRVTVLHRPLHLTNPRTGQREYLVWVPPDKPVRYLGIHLTATLDWGPEYQVVLSKLNPLLLFEEAILMMELPRRHATSLSGSRLAPITIVISRG